MIIFLHMISLITYDKKPLHEIEQSKTQMQFIPNCIITVINSFVIFN